LTCTPIGNQNTEGVGCRWQTRIVAQGEEEELLLDNNEGLDLAPEIEHFFECVDTGRRPETDGLMARRITAVVLDAYRHAAADEANA